MNNKTSNITDSTENTSTPPFRIPAKKESKIQRINGYNKTPKPSYEESTSQSTVISSAEELTVMPLQEHIVNFNKTIDPNAIDKNEHLLLLARNHSDDKKHQLLLQGQEIIEPQAVATAASILDGLNSFFYFYFILLYLWEIISRVRLSFFFFSLFCLDSFGRLKTITGRLIIYILKRKLYKYLVVSGNAMAL